MLIKIPKRKDSYSLYVKGFLTGKYYQEGKGSLLCAEGTAVGFYSYSDYRRAYIFCENDAKGMVGIPLLTGKLPLIRENVAIIYFAEGRKIDLLKFSCYNLESLFGSRIYKFPVSYWLKIAALIDLYSVRKSITSKTKRNLRLLTEKYIRERSRLNEDL